MAREMDPLLGIVRPTLGGLYLALSLFGPLVGARAVAIEKDRRTMHALLLQSGSAARLVGRKWLAAFLGAALPWTAAAALALLWRALGGHLQAAETAAALGAYLLYAALAAAVGVAAGAYARSFAQAATFALLAIAVPLAIDAAEGFSALAWLGGAAAWSPTTYLRPFERGVVDLAGAAWLAAATGGMLALAWAGCRGDLHGARRLGAVTAAVAALLGACALARHAPGAWDASEARRQSLPPAAARELARLPGRLEIVAELDREDSRRLQLESDTLAKLRLARPDLRVRWPPDERAAPAAAAPDDRYGRLTLQLGDRSVETRSTSRREIVTLIFELGGRPLPDWSQPDYPGYPTVVGGGRRALALAASYGMLPLALLAIGVVLTFNRRRTR
jgi:hypothetical protein